MDLDPHGTVGRDALEDHDRGLAFDLPRLLDRRGALRLIAGAGLVTFVACSSDSGESAASTTAPTTPPSTSGTGTGGTTQTTVGTGGDCTTIPAETAGPFPGDGSNGPNILSQSGVVRRDIRSSFGTGSGVAAGVPLTINLTIQSRANGCRPLADAAVYLWHCDREGGYSMYSPGVTNENYLRGVQETDANGRVSFLSIFPAAYPGRWPHAHFEVYPSMGQASASGTTLSVSQLALPEDICRQVFATSGYGDSLANLSRTPLASDNVFRDGFDQQVATVSGTVASGLTASLNVAV